MKYKYYLIGIICSLTIFGCEQHYNFNKEDITNMYSSYVEEWINEANISFDKAEKDILQKPAPNPVIVGPDPDPIKCICKGTGIIVQGDKHTTPCPFHSEQTQGTQKDARKIK